MSTVPRHRAVQLALLVLSGLCSACASQLPSADLVARKSTLGTVAIMAEIAVVDDVSGDKLDKVDVPENRKSGDLLIATLTSALAKKGYRIGKTAVSSVGAGLNAEARVVRSAEDQRQTVSALPAAKPPFYLDEGLAQHPDLAQDWTSVVRLVPQYLKSKKATSDHLSSAVALAKDAESDTVLGILLEGHMISSGKSTAEGVISGLLFGYPMWQTSKVALSGIMIDGHDGTVIWTAHQELEARPNETSINSLVAGLLASLP